MPQSTKEIDLSKSGMFLFKGFPGSWKTVAVGSFPGETYWWDFDGRMKPIKKMYPDREDIFWDTYRSFEDAVLKMRRWQVDGPPLSPRGIPYKNTCVDSLTTVSKAVLNDAKRLLRPGGNVNQKGAIQVSEIEDYNRETAALGDLMSFLKTMNEDWGMNVFLTAHVITWEEAIPGKGNIGQTRTRSQLLTAGKKVAPYIPAVFDEVYQFEVESSVDGPSLKVYTDIVGDHFAKTALPLPYVIDCGQRPFYEVWAENLRAAGVDLSDNKPESE